MRRFFMLLVNTTSLSKKTGKRPGHQLRLVVVDASVTASSSFARRTLGGLAVLRRLVWAVSVTDSFLKSDNV